MSAALAYPWQCVCDISMGKHPPARDRQHWPVAQPKPTEPKVVFELLLGTLSYLTIRPSRQRLKGCSECSAKSQVQIGNQDSSMQSCEIAMFLSQTLYRVGWGAQL